MPAPTALLRRPDELSEALATPLPQEGQYLCLQSNAEARMLKSVGDDDVDHVMIDASDKAPSTANEDCSQHESVQTYHAIEGRPRFLRAKDSTKSHIADARKVLIPPHRMSPLKTAWPKLYPPLGSLPSTLSL